MLTELSAEERVGGNYIHSTPRKKISLDQRERYSSGGIESEPSSCNENIYETSGGSRKS